MAQGKAMRASQCLAREFEKNSRPCLPAVKRWIEIGAVKGFIVDDMTWVNSAEIWGNGRKLMRASQWLEREFERNSIPDKRTVKRWIQDGILEGRVIDRMTWVYSSARWGVKSEVSYAVNQLIRES